MFPNIRIIQKNLRSPGQASKPRQILCPKQLTLETLKTEKIGTDEMINN